MLKVHDFTEPELEYIRSMANFTEIQAALFELRSKEITHERCAEILHISVSTEKRINKKMIAKILRIIKT